MAKIKIVHHEAFTTKPKTDHFSSWYGVQADWHKIPQYLVLGLAVLWLLGKL